MTICRICISFWWLKDRLMMPPFGRWKRLNNCIRSSPSNSRKENQVKSYMILIMKIIKQKKYFVFSSSIHRILIELQKWPRIKSFIIILKSIWLTKTRCSSSLKVNENNEKSLFSKSIWNAILIFILVMINVYLLSPLWIHSWRRRIWELSRA